MKKRWGLILMILLSVAGILGGTIYVEAAPLRQVLHNAFGWFDVTIQGITVTATPAAFAAPTGLAITYVDDYDLLVSWKSNSQSVSTQVQVKYGSYPSSVTDGYTLYTGIGDSVDDNSVDLNLNFFGVYYVSAFSENNLGQWSSAANAQYEVDMTSLVGAITEFALIILCLGIMGIAYWRQNSFLYIGAGAILFTLGLMFMKLFIPVGIALIVLSLYTLARAFLAGKWN